MNSNKSISADQTVMRQQRLMAIGALAGGAAHDLNNLFASVRSFTHLLDEKISDPKLLDYVHLIDRTLDRATELTSGILSSLREEPEGQHSANPLPCIREISSMIKRCLPSSVTLILALPDGGHPVGLTHTDLAQVLLNLLVNARDAVDGSGSIKVLGRYLPAENPTYLELEVCDDGPGVPPEILSQIFEAFYTTKGEAGGSGLGLSIVSQVVAKGGGSIECDSVPGNCCFRIRLPITEA